MNIKELREYIKERGYTDTWISLKLKKNKYWLGDKFRYYSKNKSNLSDKITNQIKSVVKNQMEIQVKSINKSKEVYTFEKTTRIFNKEDKDKEMEFLKLLSTKYDLKQNRISFIEII